MYWIVCRLTVLLNRTRKKTELEKLKDQHKYLLEKAYIASKTNRALSDQLTFDARKIEEKIIQLRKLKN